MIPRWMRLLDRYLLRELLVPFGYCLGGFLIFWVSSDLMTELANFERRNLLPGDIAEYYLVKTPELLVTVLPIGLLLALLYTLTNHARHHEITAIRAAGVSLWRLCVPHFAVGIVCSVALFALNELWVPGANEAAELIRSRREVRPPNSLAPQWQVNLAFRNEREGRIWNIGAFNRETGEMLSPNLEWFLPDGARRRLSAARAVYTNGAWSFLDVREFLYPAGTNAEPQRNLTNELHYAEVNETPEQIRSEIRFTELNNVRAARRPVLSLREIRNYQRLHPVLSAGDRAKLETQFHGRLADPWTCLVVVLIAIPFGAPSGRRNLFVGVASSIFIAFAYLVLQRFSLALGTRGTLVPALAAWLPNLAFGLAGVWLTRRVR